MSRKHIIRASLLLFLCGIAVVIIYVILDKINNSISEKVVYVDIDELSKYYYDSLFDIYPSLPKDTPHVNSALVIPTDLDINLEKVNYVHDTSDFENMIYNKAVLDKQAQMLEMIEVLGKSAEVSKKRNALIGLMQLTPYINEYKSYNREKMYTDISENIPAKIKSYMKFSAASVYNDVLPSNINADRADELLVDTRFESQKNSVIFDHFNDMAELFTEQERTNLINNINIKSAQYLSDSKNSLNDKYKKSLLDVKNLLDSSLDLELYVPDHYYRDIKSINFDVDTSVKEDLNINTDNYVDKDTKLLQLKYILNEMASEMNIKISFEKKGRLPDYTDIFKKRLDDSWEYSNCIISNIGG